MIEGNDSGVQVNFLSGVKWTHSWELIKPLEDTGVCSGVSAVEFKDKIYVFFVTEKTPGQLVLSHLVLGKSADNTLIVEGQASLAEPGLTQHRPAVTVHDGHLFYFYTAVDKTVRYRVYSGSAWSHGEVVPGVLTDNAPSVASYGNALCLAVQGTYNGEFYHKIFDNFEWGPTIKDSNIVCKGSPSLCAYGHSLSVAITGVDGTLALFDWDEHKWKLAYASAHYKVLGCPTLYARKNFLVCASISNPDQHVVTEAIRELSDGTPTREINMHLDKTLGKYLSEPCLIQYGEQFYLIGRRPCNDLAISVYKPLLIG